MCRTWLRYVAAFFFMRLYDGVWFVVRCDRYEKGRDKEKGWKKKEKGKVEEEKEKEKRTKT